MITKLTAILIRTLSALALLTAGLAAEEVDFSQTVPFSPGMGLKADCRTGRLRITATDDTVFTIASSGQPHPSLSVSESLVTVLVTGSGFKRPGPDISLTVPRSAGLAVDIGVGDLWLEGLAGRVSGAVGIGNIGLEGLSGQANLSVGTGEVRASWDSAQALPRQCRLYSGIGGIVLSLPAAAPARIDADAGLGKVSGLDGYSIGSTSPAEGDSAPVFSLSTGIGDIRVLRGRHDPEARRRGRWQAGRRRHAPHNSGIGGGFFLSWPDRSYRDFNASTSGFGYPAVDKEGLSWGGEGYLQFDRFRIGILGFGNQLDARSTLNDTMRFVDYDFSYGGLTLEHVVLRSPRVDLSLGAMLGGGEYQVRLAKARRSDVTWAGAAGLDDYREVTVDASGFAAMPLARLKVRLWSWLSLQAHAGYLYCRPGDWKYRQDQDLFNVPRIDASGWTFALGPHFGF